MDLFEKSYAFLEGMRSDETHKLQTEAAREKEPERKAQLLQLITKRVCPPAHAAPPHWERRR